MDLDDDELWATQYSRNYVKKSKIIEMIKELEFEIKHAELDKCSQYYDYIECRKFAINKLYELLGAIK